MIDVDVLSHLPGLKRRKHFLKQVKSILFSTYYRARSKISKIDMTLFSDNPFNKKT